MLLSRVKAIPRRRIHGGSGVQGRRADPEPPRAVILGMRTPKRHANEEHWVLRMPEGRRTAARHRRGAVRRAKHICPPARCTPSARGPEREIVARWPVTARNRAISFWTGPREGKAHAAPSRKRMFLRCGNRSFCASQEENQAVNKQPQVFVREPLRRIRIRPERLCLFEPSRSQFYRS